MTTALICITVWLAGVFFLWCLCRVSAIAAAYRMHDPEDEE